MRCRISRFTKAPALSARSVGLSLASSPPMRSMGSEQPRLVFCTATPPPRAGFNALMRVSMGSPAGTVDPSNTCGAIRRQWHHRAPDTARQEHSNRPLTVRSVRPKSVAHRRPAACGRSHPSRGLPSASAKSSDEQFEALNNPPWLEPAGNVQGSWHHKQLLSRPRSSGVHLIRRKAKGIGLLYLARAATGFEGVIFGREVR